MPATPPAARADSFFLPDFCNVGRVFAVVVIGELLAIVLTLAPLESDARRWDDLSVISLFVQWVGLTSIALLCSARPWLARLGERRAAVVSYLILLADTAVMTEAAYAITNYAGMGNALGNGHTELLLRNLAISAIVSFVTLRYFYVQHQWKNNMQAESRSRIAALHARIRPHFLFNCLNTIASLTRDKPALAEQAIEDLADLFRGSLAEATHMVTLEQEFDLARRYLNIEKLRLGERLQVHWHLNDIPLDALIPQLTIQPLLENAIYHGIEPLLEGGTVRIDGHRYDDQICLTLSNPLAGVHGAKRKGNQVAQDNVRQRLAAVYGDTGALTIHQNDKDYHVTIAFPYLTQTP